MSFPQTPFDEFPEFRDRHGGQPHIESHNVPLMSPFRVELEQLPQLNSVVVGNMVAVDCFPSKDTEFYVDYATASVLLHPSLKGKQVVIHYEAIGSVLRASELNRIFSAIRQLQQEVYALKHAQPTTPVTSPPTA